jgi:hypothetical protein
MSKYLKDPDAVLDYRFDFAASTNGTGDSDYLESGETISTATVTAESGLTVDSESITDTDTSVTAWLSGGTVGNEYDVTCRVTTSAGRTDDRTIVIKVEER